MAELTEAQFFASLISDDDEFEEDSFAEFENNSNQLMIHMAIILDQEDEVKAL